MKTVRSRSVSKTLDWNEHILIILAIAVQCQSIVFETHAYAASIIRQ